jgi:signal transduction histidine kinase
MPEQARARLARIVTQGERSAHLVRQILDISRASISQLQSLDLASFLKRATSFLEHAVPENIPIVLEIDPGTHHIRADPDRLRQVLTNLATNARDAMPEGGALPFQVSGFTRKLNERPPCPGMPPGEWVLLSVSDTGTGIPVEVLPHIFEPFFTTKDPGKGAGLGLAQV